jgi:ribonuclease HI
MKIEGTVYGYSNNGKTAFGVMMECGDTKYEKIIALKSGNLNVAELHAAEYAFKCIANKDSEVSIMTCNTYLKRMLDKNDEKQFKSKPEKNIDLVNAVRNAANEFKNLVINIGKSDSLRRIQESTRALCNE